MIGIIDLTVRPRTPVLGEWLRPRKIPYSCSALLLGCSHKFVLISQFSLTMELCLAQVDQGSDGVISSCPTLILGYYQDFISVRRNLCL
jgi:hypothetical protein